MARPYGRGRRLFNLIAPWPIVLWVLAALVWPGAVSAPRSAVAAEQPKLLLLGDSLFAGYGLPPAEGFAAKLDAELRARGLDVALIDGGVSGDTTAGGLARLDWLLAEQPTHAIVELGGNDVLRGLPPEDAFRNLDTILPKPDAAGVEVLLAGMYAQPHLGPDYAAACARTYPPLAPHPP